MRPRPGSDGGASLTNTKEHCTFEAGVVPERGEVTHRVTHQSLVCLKCRAGIGGPLPWGCAVFLCTLVFRAARPLSADHSVPTCEDLRGPSGQAVHCVAGKSARPPKVEGSSCCPTTFIPEVRQVYPSRQRSRSFNEGWIALQGTSLSLTFVRSIFWKGGLYLFVGTVFVVASDSHTGCLFLGRRGGRCHPLHWFPFGFWWPDMFEDGDMCELKRQHRRVPPKIHH